MKHDHDKHHCECKHERLRFCAKCRVPHCLDCGKEWQEKQYYSSYYYPNSNPWITYTGLTKQDNATSGYVQSGNLGGTFTQTLASDNTCNHQ